MARRGGLPPTVAARVVIDDMPGAVPDLAGRIAAAGGTIRTMSTIRRIEGDGAGPSSSERGADGATTSGAELEIEVESLSEEALVAVLDATPGLRARLLTRSLDRGPSRPVDAHRPAVPPPAGSGRVDSPGADRRQPDRPADRPALAARG